MRYLGGGLLLAGVLGGVLLSGCHTADFIQIRGINQKMPKFCIFLARCLGNSLKSSRAAAIQVQAAKVSGVLIHWHEAV